MDAALPDSGSTAPDATANRGLDDTVRSFFTQPFDVVSKNADAVYVANGFGGPDAPSCTRYDGPYAPLEEITLLRSNGDATAPTSSRRAVCLGPGRTLGLNPPSRSVAYDAARQVVALTAVSGTRGTVFAMTVKVDDPGWGSPGYPTPKWGLFPDVDPPPTEPAQVPHASTFDGTSLRVVGTSPAGSALSLVFEEGAPGPDGATLHATAASDPGIRAFYSVVAAPGGGAFAAGPSATGSLALVKLTGSSGLTRLPDLPIGDVRGTGLAVDPAGRLVILVRTGLAGLTTLLRLTAAGSLDTSFGGNGVATLPVLNPRGESLDVFTDADSAILVGGLVPEPDGDPIRGGLARILPNGELDPAYGSAGIARAPVRELGPGEVRAHPASVLLAVSADAAPRRGRALLFVLEGARAAGYAFTP